MRSFLQDVRDRKVVQWTLAYLAGAWLVVEVVGELSDIWAWPDVVARAVTVVAGVGVLVTAVLAWYHGERGRQRVGGTELLMLATLFLIAAALLAALGGGAGPPTAGDPEAGAGPGPTSLAAPAGADPRPSIAVLPFRDLSPAGDQAWFGEGVAEEILNALTKVSAIRVQARTSSFRLRDADIVTIGERLGVGTVLEGSVRRERDTVRVTAQLTDAETGFNLWSEQYDRAVERVIAIQEDIARRVVEELRVELARDTELVSARTDSPEAYDHYLLGRSDWNARGDGLARSLDHFRAALEIDPRFALAYSGLADAYVLLFEYNRMTPDEALPLARRAAERALELDPTLAEAHASRAEILAAGREWEASEREFRRALELNPGYLTAHHWYGWLLAHLARHDEAIEYLEGAKALDPLSAIVRRDLAGAYHHAGRYDEAIDEALECLAARLHPDCTGVDFVLGRALVAAGRPEEALAAVEEYGGAVRDLALEGLIMAALGRDDEARSALDRYRREIRASGELDRPITHLYLAELYTALGERDAALDAVERAEALGLATGPVLVRAWPHFAPIRDEPRFQAVLDRLGYPPRPGG